MRNIDWAATFTFSAVRIACASVLLVFFMMFSGASGLGEVVSIILVAPLFIAGCGIFSMIFGWLGEKNVPFAGLIGLVVGLPLLAGDPIVWLLSKIKPEWIPAANPSFFNPPLVLVNKEM